MKAIRWLLARLPGKMCDLKATGKRLKTITAKIQGRGNGLDRQAAGDVTRAWLQESPEPLSVSMESVYNRGGGDMFGIPCIDCPSCHELLAPRWRGRKRRLCDECYRQKVRLADPRVRPGDRVWSDHPR